MIVDLSPTEVARADAVALARQTTNERFGRRDANNLRVTTQKGALAVHTLGCRCELAGSIAYGLRWNDLVDDPFSMRLLPDLGTFVDVKGIAQPYHRLMVPAAPGRNKVMPEWAYLLVSAAEHPRYRIIGWAWGSEIAECPVVEPQTGRPARIFPTGQLRGPVELWAEVAKRNPTHTPTGGT